jgi:small subunit ribosomal protein S5
MTTEGKKDFKKGKPPVFKAEKELKEELLAIDRVTRVTSWGRQLRFRAVMLVWDGKWKVGLWTWKSWEVVDAIAKAINDAKKNMVKVKLEENGSVPYNIDAKYKSAKIMVHQASDWVWIIAWWAMRKVLSVAWYKNVLAKRYGSSNLINNARATIKALTSFKN